MRYLQDPRCEVWSRLVTWVLIEVGAPTTGELCEYFKTILYEAGISFTVAPFSAAAQVRIVES